MLALLTLTLLHGLSSLDRLSRLDNGDDEVRYAEDKEAGRDEEDEEEKVEVSVFHVCVPLSYLLISSLSETGSTSKDRYIGRPRENQPTS